MERLRMYAYLRRSGFSRIDALDHSDLLVWIVIFATVLIPLVGTAFLYAFPGLLIWIWGG